jgi:hypothetical protein
LHQPFVLVHAVLAHEAFRVVLFIRLGPVEQDVVVGPARLQHRLHPGHVAMHGTEIPPQRIGGIQLRGGVEKPPRPGGIGW